MRSLLIILVLAFWMGVVSQVPAQVDSEPAQVSAEVQAKVDKYIKLAKQGRAAVRPQAARRLSQLGAPALASLREEVGADGDGLAALGPHLVEILCEFDDPGLRAQLWRALADPDFPWRGPAARALAKSAEDAELDTFLSLAVDHLWQVRAAALTALAGLEAEQHAAEVRGLLSDQDGAVRRQAAALLDTWGEHGALRYLVEDLRREDRYFRMPLGAQARFDAARILSERLGDDFDFDPSKSPRDESNAIAIEAIEAAAKKRAEPTWPELPSIARAAPVTEGDVIGLELRSCRRGEFYLRWNEADLLYVGTGNAAVIALDPGVVQGLEQALSRELGALGELRYWGQAGCDLEQLRMVDAEGVVDSYLISKGQASAGDLRPAALDAAVRLLLATLPDELDPDPRLSRLRSRARAALEVLGGEL